MEQLKYNSAMKRHYCTLDEIQRDDILLQAEDARHLATVLRVAIDDEVECFDGNGAFRLYRIAEVGKRHVLLQAGGELTHVPLPNCLIHLYPSICKGERWDWLLEKAVELGVNSITPVLTTHCVVKLSPNEYSAKLEKWSRRLIEAAKQCGARYIPKLNPPTLLNDLTFPSPAYVAALAEQTEPFVKCLPTKQPDVIAYFTGPEGDYTPEELQYLAQKDATFVSLGPQVLRAETAAICGLSLLSLWRDASRPH